MEGIQQRSVDGVALASDQPLSRDLETVEDNYTAVPESDLVNWPSMTLRPFLRCGRMVLSEHIEVPMQERAAWDLWNSCNRGKVDIEKTEVD